MNLSIKGVTGTLQWGYHRAASVTHYAVARGVDGRFTLTATVDQADAYRVSQRPLVFVATTALGAWKWPVLELQIQGASLSAVLGPKEK